MKNKEKLPETWLQCFTRDMVSRGQANDEVVNRFGTPEEYTNKVKAEALKDFIKDLEAVNINEFGLTNDLGIARVIQKYKG